MAEKFVKAVAKPSRPDMNPIRYYINMCQYERILFSRVACSEILGDLRGILTRSL